MILSIAPTNACNLKCLHCMRDKLEDREFIRLDLVQKVLQEARIYGISNVSITGGEPTLHPQFDELLGMIAREGFTFHIITNGFQFRSRVLPVLRKPQIRRCLSHISISLDGASARTHDANRGEGAFNAAMEMASLCKIAGIPFNLITIVNNFNKAELTEIALLGSGLEAIFHLFGPLHATPLSVQKGMVPSPREVKGLFSFIANVLARSFKMPIVTASGAYCGAALLPCHTAKDGQVHIDFLGNAIFCCTLSHFTDDGVPDRLGEEVVADLDRESLGAAILKQNLLAGRLNAERLEAARDGRLAELDHFHCHWCLRRFGKLGWLDHYPDSPWAEAPAERSKELVAVD